LKYDENDSLVRPFTFSNRNARGVVSRMTRTACGNMFRASLSPACLPPIENGWQGGPPATTSSLPAHFLKSTSRTSRCITGQFAINSHPRFWFSRILAHESRSHSMTASCSKPSKLAPKARPPAPANSSMHFMFCSENDAHFYPVVQDQQARIPRLRAPSNQQRASLGSLRRHAGDSREAWASKNRGVSSATGSECKACGDAKNNHARKSPFDEMVKQCPAFPAGISRAIGIEIQVGE